MELLMLPRRIFGLQSDCYSSQRSREDNIHMSFWHLCIQTHVIQTVQRPRNIWTMHDGSLIWLFWRQFRSFHGRLQCLWKRFWELSCSVDKDIGGMRQETTGVKLGKIPLHGTRESGAQAYHLEQRTGGGQGQDRGHPKPPSSRYYTRSKELSQACRLLPEIHTRLCQSLQATHHPSLQRQRFHHRQRREARIYDVEASTNRGTNTPKS